VLWIDSPAGVGWSVAGDAEALIANDLQTSQDALQAMKSFYVKFPEYLPNELFISGESYAGVYVPWLSWQIYTNNQQVGYDPTAVQMNLQGYMVGNGATNWEFDVEPSFAQTLRWFNIIPPSLLDSFEANDCHYYFYPAVNPDVQTPKCDALWIKINEYASGLNWYDLYRPVYPDSSILAKQAELRANRYGSVTIDGVEKRYKKGMTPQEYMPWAKHLQMADSAPIILGDYLTDYMNMAETRTAFNIPSSVQAWEMCSSDVVYTEQHFASEWIYQTLRYSGVRKLFYSGDTDGAVNTYGSKRWIANLNWSVTKAWKPWFTDEQVSGYAESYDGDFDFVTVKGVGHMAPQWARKAVL
jgi:serine carboxypeptidase-like clade 1